MMMIINEYLNDDCLIQVFNQFTLQQLLCLRIVCQRWKSIIELLCQKKASLQLFSTVEDGLANWEFAKKYSSDSFVVEKFGHGGNQLFLGLNSAHGEQQVQLLKALFPNVKRLVFRCKQKVVPLLENWPLLEYLCLYMVNDQEADERTCSLLNAMFHLKSLHLYRERPTTSISNIILSRLEHFSLSFYYGDITNVLGQLGTPLRQLYLDHIPCSLAQLRQLLQMCPQITSQLTHLTLTNIRSSESSLQDRKHFFKLICSHFTSLTHLDITFTRQVMWFYLWMFVPFNTIFLQTSLLELHPDLSKLQHLHSLKLQINSIIPEASRIPEHKNSHSLKPIETIKTLYLIVNRPYDGTHLAHFELVPVILPRVEEFFFQSNDPDLNPLLDAQVKKFSCLRKYKFMWIIWTFETHFGAIIL